MSAFGKYARLCFALDFGALSFNTKTLAYRVIASVFEA
jgi:hypothetical protein